MEDKSNEKNTGISTSSFTGSKKQVFTGICGSCTKRVKGAEYAEVLKCPHCDKVITVPHREKVKSKK